jgi:general secretion pathway protein G
MTVARTQKCAPAKAGAQRRRRLFRAPAFAGAHPRSKHEQERGFTLVELMVVIVILGLLATIVVINVMPAMDRAAATTARANISQIEEGLKIYKLNNGRYPTAEEGLAALVPATVDRLPNDPWGNPYRYGLPGRDGKDFTVITWGADGREGGSGENEDISN